MWLLVPYEERLQQYIINSTIFMLNKNINVMFLIKYFIVITDTISTAGIYLSSAKRRRDVQLDTWV
jgi:hypothetical protein